jgi:small-conductance mechanosensitive channel
MEPRARIGRMAHLRRGVARLLAAVVLGWLAVPAAHAQKAEHADRVVKVERVDATVPEAAKVTVLTRNVAVLRAALFGLAPAVRAAEAHGRIERALRSGGPLQVGVAERDEGFLVQVDGATIFAITIDDTVERTLPAARETAQQAAAALAQAIDESREARDMKALMRGAVWSGVATLVLGGLLWGLNWLRQKGENWLVQKAVVHADRLRVGGERLVGLSSVMRAARSLLTTAFWLIVAVLVYEWLSLVLGQFAVTRAWGEQLNGYLWGLAERFVLAIVGAVPDLLAAALIFWLAYLLSSSIRSFFGKVAVGRVRLSWLDADVALTTSKLFVTVVWLFALAMAYPYLPGSETEAFKGLSVLFGLMLSLGASNLVGQLASGLILTYTHAMRPGEYVRIDQNEGTVITLGAFTTRIRTGMGEELTLSNSLVLGAVTRNYSRTVKGQGFIVDTTVTIGYDAPWRQVHAMLTEAALRTPGVLADPPPHVFQVALSDFYPEYRLVCQAVPSEPRPRAEVMSLLHQNIQDLFNQHGVQIMSPHYLGDPEQVKVVPRARWYEAPAKPPRGDAA